MKMNIVGHSVCMEEGNYFGELVIHCGQNNDHKVCAMRRKYSMRVEIMSHIKVVNNTGK